MYKKLKKGATVIITKKRSEDNLWTLEMIKTINKVGKYTGDVQNYNGHNIYKISFEHPRKSFWYYFTEFKYCNISAETIINF